MLVLQAVALLSNVISGIGVVLANKAVFTTAYFTFPVVLTALHYAVNLGMLLVLAWAGVVKPRSAASMNSIRVTTLVWALHNALSNLSLSKNSVGLYQISKLLVTPLICVLERVVYGRTLPASQALALLGACVGVACATISDVQMTLPGAATALASACASAVLKVLQQEVLQRLGWTSLELMYQTWGPQLVLLLLSIPVLDPSSLTALQGYEWTSLRVSLLLLSALAAFALNISSLTTIQMTSALAIVLLGQAKTMLTMLGGFVFFDAAPPTRLLTGAALAIISIAAYTYISITSPRAISKASDEQGDAEGEPLQASAEKEPLQAGEKG